MSLFTESSLCLVPSGVKDGKVYSIKPTDGSGDLTFSRGSDIEATRVASNGYIQKAKVNLVLQSNTFDTSWLNSGIITKTSGQSGYDGSSDAWLLTKSSGGGFIYQNIAFSSVGTFSVYAKAGALNWIRIRDNIGVGAYFDLSGSGAVGSTNLTIDANIQSVGGGWFRCSVSASWGSSHFRIYPGDANGDTSGTSGNIYIQDAQLNYGLVAQEYQETTTTSVVTGITNDMPRLDYSGGASCPSLKLEPSRTNIFTNDTYFGGADWNKIGVSPTANNATSPEGVTNAVLLSETAINDQHSLYPTISVTSGNAYTASCFVKQGTGSSAPQYIGFRFRGGGFTDAGGLVVDLVNKVATYEGGSLTNHNIEDYGNGWLRVSITQTASVGSSSAGLVLFFNNNISNAYSTDYMGNTNADMLVYGMQIESGAYVSSLIPCNGTSATRTAEVCVKTGISSLIGQTEGTIYLEADIQKRNEADFYVALSAGSVLGDAIYLYQPSSGNLQLLIRKTGNADGAISILSANWTAGLNKVAIAYTATTAEVFINGVTKGTTSFVSAPACSQFTIGSRPDVLGTLVGAGPYNQALIFKTRLSNADLATLTA